MGPFLRGPQSLDILNTPVVTTPVGKLSEGVGGGGKETKAGSVVKK